MSCSRPIARQKGSIIISHKQFVIMGGLMITEKDRLTVDNLKL